MEPGGMGVGVEACRESRSGSGDRQSVREGDRARLGGDASIIDAARG